jgi:hypothetical protein
MAYEKAIAALIARMRACCAGSASE